MLRNSSFFFFQVTETAKSLISLLVSYEIKSYSVWQNAIQKTKIVPRKMDNGAIFAAMKVSREHAVPPPQPVPKCCNGDKLAYLGTDFVPEVIKRREKSRPIIISNVDLLTEVGEEKYYNGQSTLMSQKIALFALSVSAISKFTEEFSPIKCVTIGTRLSGYSCSGSFSRLECRIFCPSLCGSQQVKLWGPRPQQENIKSHPSRQDWGQRG